MELVGCMPNTAINKIPDLPKHGREISDNGLLSIPRVAQTLARGLPQNSIIVANDVGAKIALEIAAHSMNQVAGLVLINGQTLTSTPEQAIQDFFESAMVRGYDAIATDYVKGGAKGTLPAARVSDLVRESKKPGLLPIGEYWMSIARWDSSRFKKCLDDVACPILALQSADLDDNYNQNFAMNGLSSAKWMESLSRFSDARIIEIPDTGTYPMIRAPKAMAHAVCEFAKGALQEAAPKEAREMVA